MILGCSGHLSIMAGLQQKRRGIRTLCSLPQFICYRRFEVELAGKEGGGGLIYWSPELCL